MQINNLTIKKLEQEITNPRENALVICDGELAQIYEKQFQRWFNQGTPVSSRY